MKTLRTLFVLSLLSFAGVGSVHALTVYPTNPQFGLYDLGSFSSGSYLITASGVVGLDLSDGFLMQPDGLPVSSVTTPGYEYFNPDGSFDAEGSYGPGGENVKLGALMGTLTSTPTSGSDWFQIGYSKVVVLHSTSHIYLAVNDIQFFYSNNHGFYTAEISAIATSVPDASSTVGLLTAAMVCVGLIARSRR